MIIYTTSRIERIVDRLVVTDQFSKSFKYHYLFIISHIRSYHFFDKRYESNDFVPVYLKLLRRFVSYDHANKFLDNLVEAGVLQKDNYYQVGKKAYGYRINPELKKDQFKLTEIKDKKLLKKLTDKFQGDKDNVLLRTDSYGYVTKCMENLTLDIKAADRHVRGMEEGEKKDSAELSVQYFNLKFAVIDDVGNRLHNNLTNLSSDIRKYLTYESKKIVQVDIMNSQPLFLYLMLREKYFVSEAEMDKYKKVVCEYGFYEFFAEKLSIDLTKGNRKAFKQKIFGGVLFDRNRRGLSKYEEVFKKEFPEIFYVIRKIKEKQYKDVAIMLQKTESKFIFSCVDKIRIENKLPMFTIHDSICTTLGKEGIIEKVVREEFYKQYSIDIKLNTEIFA